MESSSLKKKLLTCALLITLVIPILTNNRILPVETLDTSNYYQSQKNLKNQSQRIDKDLSELMSNLEDVTEQKETYEEEVKSLQAKIDKAQNAAKQSKEVKQKYEAQKLVIEQNIEELREQMKNIYLELQKQKLVSPVQEIISSRNLGQALGKMYTLSSLQAKANDVKDELDKKNVELTENIKHQEKAIIQAKEAEAAAKSKQDQVNQLIAKYKGKEDEYKKDRAELISKKNSIEAQSRAKQREFERQQAAARAGATGASNTGGRGGNGDGRFSVMCFFDDPRPLSVPAGYFGIPTTGYRSQGYHCGHDGVDIANAYGTALYAVASGVVVRKEYHGGGYGNFVVVKHVLPSGQRVYALYAHMRSQSPLGIGSSVSRGQVVGYMGSTGYSTGNHLHFTLMSDSYERSGLGCRHGSSKCYRPTTFIPGT